LALGGAAAIVHTVERALDWRQATERRAAVTDLRERRAALVEMIDDSLCAPRRDP
jgi:hypothetical protein